MRYAIILCAAALMALAWSNRAGVTPVPLEDLTPEQITILRSSGPIALSAACTQFDQALSDNPRLSPATAQKMRDALDAIAGQRDAHAARLYWYTDLPTAFAAAQAQGKPILSLRLLGRLDSELSCANSRFFRTALYPNQQIGDYLRENFILYWESVRPVPVVTIDFGDGRKIQRTVTGNSIHYVLSPQGQIVDALPGLYGPAEFLAALQKAHEVARSDSLTAQAIREYQIGRREALASAAQTDLQKLGLDALPEDPSDPNWKRLGELHEPMTKLDANSRNLMASKFPAAAEANRLSMAKSVAQTPAIRMVKPFEQNLARDTVFNQYALRPKLLGWLIESESIDLRALNERVYAELFLTPSNDPWLGLMPNDVYSAIDNNGATVARDSKSK